MCNVRTWRTRVHMCVRLRPCRRADVRKKKKKKCLKNYTLNYCDSFFLVYYYRFLGARRALVAHRADSDSANTNDTVHHLSFRPVSHARRMSRDRDDVPAFYIRISFSLPGTFSLQTPNDTGTLLDNACRVQWRIWKCSKGQFSVWAKKKNFVYYYLIFNFFFWFLYIIYDLIGRKTPRCRANLSITSPLKCTTVSPK